MNTMYELRWAGQITGPFTKEQIEAKLAFREIGLAYEVKYKGKWILLEDFDAALEKDAQVLRDQETQRELKEKEDAAAAAAAEAKKKEEEQAAIYHQRQIELIEAEKSHPPEPAIQGSIDDDQTPPPPPWGNSSTAAKSSGLGVFVAIVLGVLWYQGYLDPADIPALWGNSKYINVVRNDRPAAFGGKSVDQAMSSLMTSVTWKSSRGDNRKEIRVICSGRRGGDLKRISFIVNKRDKSYEVEE